MHVSTPRVDVLSGLKDESCLGDVHRYCDARFLAWFHEKLTKRGFRINAVENVEKAMKQVVHALSMRAKGRSARCTREAWAATQRRGRNHGRQRRGRNHGRLEDISSIGFHSALCETAWPELAERPKKARTHT